MEDTKIREIAIIEANRSQFKSNYPYNHKSYEDGFFQGMKQALDTSSVVGRSGSFVCGHPPNRTYLNDGNWNCEKCGGQWPSIANK